MLEQMMGAAGGKVRLASMLSAASSLIWPLQARVVAMAIAGLLGQIEEPGPLAAASVFVLLGLVRAVLNHQAERLLFAAGVTIVSRAREEIVRREMRTTDSGGAASTAVLASEKLDHMIPYVTRYAPAQARVMTVPLVILALSFWFSWAAGLVLLVSGPLIPVFMALVGLAAKEASQRQMADIGTLNDLLIDRLSALVDIRLLDAGPAVIADFAASADQLRARTMNVLKIAFLSSTVLELFAAIGVAMMATSGLCPAGGHRVRILRSTAHSGRRDFPSAAGSGFLPAIAGSVGGLARQGRGAGGCRRILGMAGANTPGTVGQGRRLGAPPRSSGDQP